MKSKNFIKHITFLVLGTLYFTSLKAQCPECPVSVNNATPSYLQLAFDPIPPAISGKVKIQVGPNDPRNGVYNAFQVNPSSWGIFNVPASFCCDSLEMEMTILEKACLVNANQYAGCGPALLYPTDGSECEGFLENCQNEIADYIMDHLARINNTGCAKWEGECNTTGPIKRTGKVGIGTSIIPAGYDLGVKQGIVTDGVMVRLCSYGDWCDYVFEEDYSLTPLVEVKQFIDQKGHLPGMSSAQELEDDGGFELKAIKIQQLEKLEEAYLHLLTAKDRLDQLRQRVTALKAENAKLCQTKN